MLPGNSKKILFQNGPTDSENNSINAYTFDRGVTIQRSELS